MVTKGNRNTSKHRKTKKSESLKEITVKEFYFKPKLKKINWRLLSTLNVADIVGQNNIDALQDCIEMITFCNIHDDGTGLLICRAR